MAIKVFYDHQAFCLQRFGGVSRYFVELISHLPSEVQANLPGLLTDNAYVEALHTDRFIKRLPALFPRRQRFVEWLNRINSVWPLMRCQYDVIHATYYSPYVMSKLGKAKLVITVHDMIHEKFPHFFKHRDNTAKHKQMLVTAADHIYVVSESTRRDLMAYYQVPEEKITTTYLASNMTYDKQPLSASLCPFPLNHRYVLFVGGRGGYKNFCDMLRAIAPLLTEHDLQLWCIGGGAFNPCEQELAAAHGVADRLFQSAVSDEDMACIYSHALCFIFPSWYEGFGIPLLEAFQCHCPVVCSNGSSLGEVSAGAALCFDPYSIADMRTQIAKMLSSSQVRNSYIEAGIKRAKPFSWRKTADQTAQLYTSLLG